MNYQDYVCGTKFKELANIIVEGSTAKWQNLEIEGKYVIIYANTHDFKNFVDFRFERECVLITHNSDGCVKTENSLNLREYDANAYLLPDNVVKWYAQNVDFEYERIVPIPIGLENRYCFPYDKAQMLFEAKEKYKDIKPTKDLYLNCNINTNPGERSELYELCQNNKNITVKYGSNGQDYEQYLKDILNHKMVLCPEGNGLDCHRTWETLYLDRYPILINKPYLRKEFYTDIPTLLFPNWRSALAYYPMIYKATKILDRTFHKNTLSMEYWKQRIYNAE